MSETTWASGRWQVKEGMTDEFVTRWKAWLSWTSSTCSGFRSATLIQNDDDKRQFTSFSDWDDDASREAWMTSDGFRERMAPVREVCDDVQAASFHTAAAFTAAAPTS